jgi:hypothetical protein
MALFQALFIGLPTRQRYQSVISKKWLPDQLK